MSAKHNDGGPAFPLLVGTTDRIDNVNAGMSLRDYFAAAALTGIIAYPDHGSDATYDPAREARTAYQFADAMLVERTKERA